MQNAGGNAEPDMMATALSTLPPPAIQNKEPLDGVPSYEALMKDVLVSGDGNQRPPQLMPPQSPQQQQVSMQQQMAQPMTQQYYPQQQQQQQMMQPQSSMMSSPTYQQQNYQYDYYVTPQPRQVPPVPRRAATLPPPKKKVGIDVYKSPKSWALAGVLFVLIAYGIPKLKTSIPSLVSQNTGKLSLPALAVISSITAMSYTVASEYL